MEAAVFPNPSSINLAPRTVKLSIRFNGWEVSDSRPYYSDEDFLEFCRLNPDAHVEQDKLGNIIVLPPVSYDSGNQEGESIIDLGLWNRRTKLGKIFSPSTLFRLPDGEKRMADAAWVSKERDAQLTVGEGKTFARVVPDFVIEVRSPSDDIENLKSKMSEIWIPNGVRLAWLIDPLEGISWVYRANGSVNEVRGMDKILSGEDVLPGFEFELKYLKG